MARSRTVTFGAVNVVLPPPHEPTRYVDLFRAAYSNRGKAKLLGDWVGMIGALSQASDPIHGDIVLGEIYKFVDLDVTQNWFNMAKGKVAGADDMARLVIPDELKPHFNFLPFVFFPVGHRLVSLTSDGADSIPISLVAKTLRGTLGSAALRKEFGEVEVTVEPAMETLEQIFQMPNLKRLDINVTSPNPDDFSDFEKHFQENMEEQNARKLLLSILAEPGEALEPNDETKKLAKVAQANGSVTGTGGGRGKTRKLSTVAHPFEHKDSYRPDFDSRSDFVLAKASEILDKIRNRR